MKTKKEKLEPYHGFKEQVEKTTNEIDCLTKKYQDNPDTILSDYDETIKNILIGIIANSRANNVFRDDLIRSFDILIRNRERICNQYGNQSSN